MQFLNDKLYPLLATLLLVVASSCWFGAPVPPPPKTLPPATEDWALPPLAELNLKKSVEAISLRNLWGIVTPADAAVAAAIKEPVWRILGIANSGTEPFVLLAYEGKPVVMLKVGDNLPDDLKIVQIDKDRFFVMTPQKTKLAYGIYKDEASK